MPIRLPTTVVVALVVGLASCGPSKRPAETSAPPPVTYTGHGLSSVPPETLAKFPPRPVAPALARKVQFLMDLRGPDGGFLSTDAKSLRFNWPVTGVSQVWRVDGPRKMPIQLTGGEDLTQVVAASPDGKFVLISRDHKGEENPGLYLQSAEGGALVEIQHKPGVQTQAQGITGDGKFVYFRANDVRKDSYTLYRYAVDTRSKDVILDESGLFHIADLKDDGHLLVTKDIGSMAQEVYEWDPAARTLVPLFGQGEREEFQVQYGPKDGEVIALTNKYSNFRRLYSWTRQNVVPLGEDLPADVRTFVMDRARSRIVYALNEGGYTRLRAMDAKSHKALKIPTLPDCDHALPVSITPDGRYGVVLIDDGSRPPQVWVIDWKLAKSEVWFAPATPERDGSTFARGKLESFPARDGTAIPTIVRIPPACEHDLCPVVVTFHGGPESQSRPGFNVTGQAFVDAGFIHVEPNVRGSDGYGKEWLRADDGPKRLQVISDIADAAKWVKERFKTSAGVPKVGIHGGSYGGYSVLMGMTYFAGSYDAGVDVVGISNLLTFLENTAPYRRALRISEYGDPAKDREALAQLSPVTHVDKIQGPLLIIQGANDPRVPAGEALQMYDRVQRRGIPVDLMLFADEGHGAQKRENRVLTLANAVAFFQKHIGSKSPSGKDDPWSHTEGTQKNASPAPPAH